MTRRPRTALQSRSIRLVLALVALTFVPTAPVGATAAVVHQKAPRTWSVQPASGDGVGTRPAFTYDLAPGGTIDDAMRVENFGTSSLTLAIYPTDAFNTESGDFDVLAGGVEPADVGTWAALPEAEITVPAGESIDVPFTLTVPDDAEPGDHAGGIVTALSTDAVDEDGNRVQVDHRVGVRIYVRVDGPLRPALTVEGTELSYSGSLAPWGRGSATLTYTVRNAGNVRLAARQGVSLKGPLGLGGRAVDLDDVPELLPGSKVRFTVPIPDAWPTVRLRAVVSLDPVGADGTDPVAAAATTWAVPWPLFGLLLVGFGAGAVVRRRRRRARATETA